LGRAAFFAGSSGFFWIIGEIASIIVFALGFAALAPGFGVTSRISKPCHIFSFGACAPFVVNFTAINYL
jgi:hypothetical protein